MTENTNTHLATFKCTTLDSSCRENRRSKFCSKELIFLAGSQANISTAERSRGDWQWHESEGESGPRHEFPPAVELVVNTSPRTPALPRVPASFLTHLTRGHKPQRPHFCLRDNSGESWRACPRILQPGVSWSLSWIWEWKKVSVFNDGEQMLGKGFMPSQGLREEVGIDLRHHMTYYPATAISLFL